MKPDNSSTNTKKNTSHNFANVTGIVLYIQYLTTFAWFYKCLAEVRRTSYTNLCIIPRRKLRQSSRALSDASIKTILSFHSNAIGKVFVPG